jgi:hypothetical protein
VVINFHSPQRIYPSGWQCGVLLLLLLLLRLLPLLR